MRIVGITAEYNPFHNGHLHHLREALRLSGAEGAVAVMSGNYVQRGLPACVDKYRRTRMALEAGVDLVIELPVSCALSSAEGFASGAAAMLQDLGVTDVAYGCEAGSELSGTVAAPHLSKSEAGSEPFGENGPIIGDISQIIAEFPQFGEDPSLLGDISQKSEENPQNLKKLAAFLLEEPPAYKEVLRTALKSGKNFPAARQEAAAAVLGEATASLLSSPNNILGIEYEKALMRLGSSIRTHAVPRSGAGYHATGTALRKAMETGDRQALALQLPKSSLDQLDYHVTAEDFSGLLSYRLAGETKQSLTAAFPWLDPQLAARIVNCYDPFLSFDGFCDLLTTRNTTRTAVSRALTRILLGLKAPKVQSPSAFHVLGFRRDSAILKTLKERSTRPLITKAADLPSGEYAAELAADDVYRLAVYKKTGIRLPDAFHAGPVIL